jgi:hypothetical protein
MLLVFAFLLLFGLVLSADCPGTPDQDERAQAVWREASLPRDSACVRLPAHTSEREEEPSHSAAVGKTILPPPPCRPARGSPFASDASPEPLIYDFCTLLC